MVVIVVVIEGQLFLTAENDEIRGPGLRFFGAGALWRTILEQFWPDTRAG